jgi:hypothetical protein
VCAWKSAGKYCAASSKEKDKDIHHRGHREHRVRPINQKEKTKNN